MAIIPKPVLVVQVFIEKSADETETDGEEAKSKKDSVSWSRPAPTSLGRVNVLQAAINGAADAGQASLASTPDPWPSTVPDNANYGISPKDRWKQLRARVFSSSFCDTSTHSDTPGLLEAFHSRVFSTSTAEECDAWIRALSEESESTFL